MQEKLEQIDTQAIDELARIKEDRDRIHEFRERAEDKKDDVDEEIYRRVTEDYERREQALDDEAAPLREQGRQEYRKLASLLDSVNDELADARSRQQELEFRHDVGEIDDDELEERLEEPKSVIARCQESLEQLGELRDRFVEAFGSEDALEEADEDAAEEATAQEAGTALEEEEALEEEDAERAPAPKGEETEADEEATQEAAVQQDETGEEVAATRLAAEAMEPPEEGAGDEAPSPDATVLADPSMLESGEGEESEEAAEGAGAQQTMVVPNARLLLHDEDGEETQEFFLGPVNYVGRAPGNHVCLEAPAVSRKHARISVGSDGFVIEDLDSPNGTFVNGGKIEGKQALEDDDEIKLGNVELSFRSP